jgi:hypothetical protein
MIWQVVLSGNNQLLPLFITGITMAPCCPVDPCHTAFIVGNNILVVPDAPFHVRTIAATFNYLKTFPLHG